MGKTIFGLILENEKPLNLLNLKRLGFALRESKFTESYGVQISGMPVNLEGAQVPLESYF